MHQEDVGIGFGEALGQHLGGFTPDDRHRPGHLFSQANDGLHVVPCAKDDQAHRRAHHFEEHLDRACFEGVRLDLVATFGERLRSLVEQGLA